MIDLGPDVRLARDRDQLVERFEQLPAFVADVGDVHPVVLGGNFRERDQLVGLRKEGRGINQRRSDTERALLHCLANELAHFVELLRSRRTVFIADEVNTRRCCSDERSDVW